MEKRAKNKKYPTALTIAGTDPSGGAGIQADLKAFSALACYGMSAIVAVVDQNTCGVKGVHPIPVDFVKGQIVSVLDDIGADAIKIGMLHSSELIFGVQEVLAKYKKTNIILDPVMVATSGDALLQKDAIDTLRDELIPHVRVITPNIPEAELLLNVTIKEQKDLIAVVKDLSVGGTVSVLLKGGHLEDEEFYDVFYNAEEDEVITLASKRVVTNNTHGTGCTLSSALTAFLARGFNLNEAVLQAKRYTAAAIEQGAAYEIGKGNGPVHHFHAFW